MKYDEEYDDGEEEHDDEEPEEICPYCGNVVCSSDIECPSCIEHLEECAKQAGEIHDVPDWLVFEVTALY